MTLNHDPTRPLAARILDAGIEDDGEAYERVWVRFEVDEEVWAEVQAEWEGAGAPGGFSWSGSVELAFLPAETETSLTVDLAADA
jgi:hypothetical protein